MPVRQPAKRARALDSLRAKAKPARARLAAIADDQARWERAARPPPPSRSPN